MQIKNAKETSNMYIIKIRNEILEIQLVKDFKDCIDGNLICEKWKRFICCGGNSEHFIAHRFLTFHHILLFAIHSI